MAMIDIGALREIVHFGETPQQRLTRQMHQLRREAGLVSKQLARLGGQGIDQAGHNLAKVTARAMQQGTAWAQQAGAAGRAAGQTVRRDPLPLLVVIATGVLMFRMLAGAHSSGEAE